ISMITLSTSVLVTEALTCRKAVIATTPHPIDNTTSFPFDEGIRECEPGFDRCGNFKFLHKWRLSMLEGNLRHFSMLEGNFTFKGTMCMSGKDCKTIDASPSDSCIGRRYCCCDTDNCADLSFID
ncbi:hypothetical protein PFISCL1PPCAC_4163, partial [Pristionchus fissidentatus]